MFGFKPIITGSPVTISSDGMEPTRFDSISKTSTSTGTPYAALLYIKKNSRKGATSVAPGAPEHSHRVRSNGKEFAINLSLVKMPHSYFKYKAYEFNSGIGKCPCGQTF